jgi:hypothetical protein
MFFVIYLPIIDILLTSNSYLKPGLHLEFPSYYLLVSALGKVQFLRPNLV